MPCFQLKALLESLYKNPILCLSNCVIFDIFWYVINKYKQIICLLDRLLVKKWLNTMKNGFLLSSVFYVGTTLVRPLTLIPFYAWMILWSVLSGPKNSMRTFLSEKRNKQPKKETCSKRTRPLSKVTKQSGSPDATYKEKRVAQDFCTVQGNGCRLTKSRPSILKLNFHIIFHFSTRHMQMLSINEWVF